MNKYKIKIKNKIYKVSLECFLLYYSWTEKNFIDSFNKSNNEVFKKKKQNMKYNTDNYTKIEIIQLKKNNGLTLIAPANKNKKIFKKLNDIWTNNTMMIAYLSSDIKYYLLDYRTKIIKDHNFKEFKYDNKIKINKDRYDDVNYDNYLTLLNLDNDLHNKIKKKSNYIQEFDETFFNKKYPSNCNINGKIIENKLYYIIPPKPSKIDIDILRNISECITDILYDENDGDITMIWSKEIKDHVKKFREN